MSRFRPVSIVLALLMGALPALPAEHAHESDAGGHHHVMVHRHAAPHHRHHDSNHGPSGGRAIDHDDDHVVTLSSSFTAPSSYSDRPPVRLLVALLAPPAPAVNDGPAVYVERLIHGPPRAPSGLRAPPLAARL